MRAAVFGTLERTTEDLCLQFGSGNTRFCTLILRVQPSNTSCFEPFFPTSDSWPRCLELCCDPTVTLPLCKSEDELGSKDVACRQRTRLSPLGQFTPLFVSQPQQLPIASHIAKTLPTDYWLRFNWDVRLVACLSEFVSMRKTLAHARGSV
jgi:hypothetical protein